MTAETSKTSLTFHDGVLAALAVVHFSGEDTLFDEIVRAVGEEDLLKAARKRGDMRYSGMSAYRNRQPKSRKP